MPKYVIIFVSCLFSVYDSPYLIGLLAKGHVEIRSVEPPQLVQSITLKQAHMISNAMR